MNLLPLVGFYWRRHDQLSSLVSGTGDGSAVLDLIKANAPVIKKHWPEMNKNGLLDDAVATLEAVLSDKPDPHSPYPDPTQR